jgi:hypothetical protein
MEREMKKESKSRKPIIKGRKQVSTAFQRFLERLAFWKRSTEAPKEEEINMAGTKKTTTVKNQSAQTAESRIGCKVTIQGKKPTETKDAASQSAPSPSARHPNTKLSGADFDRIDEAPEMEDVNAEGQEY